jgi:hypothetical protein
MERLKLIAMDKEDLGVLSTYCQDAVAKIGSLEYFPAEKRFIVTMNRYVWEIEGRKLAPERRRTVLHFNQVENVQVTGIDRSKRDDVLSLLTVTFEPDELPAGHLHLVFSGDAAIRLAVECIEVQLSDLDAAWKAKSRPAHNPG